MHLRFFGIDIKRETDILALTAFLLSVLGILYQLWGFAKGARVQLFAPEQVLLIRDAAHSAEPGVNISANMAYLNDGEAGYNAIVRSEAARFSVNGRQYEQRWDAFVTFDTSKGTLDPTNQSDATPFAVSGGAAISHNTLFAPRSARAPEPRDKNLLSWKEFVAAISRDKALTVEFSSEISGHKTLRQTVVIDVDENLIGWLNYRGFSSPSCWPVKIKK